MNSFASLDNESDFDCYMPMGLLLDSLLSDSESDEVSESELELDSESEESESLEESDSELLEPILHLLLEEPVIVLLFCILSGEGGDVGFWDVSILAVQVTEEVLRLLPCEFLTLLRERELIFAYNLVM